MRAKYFVSYLTSKSLITLREQIINDNAESFWKDGRCPDLQVPPKWATVKHWRHDQRKALYFPVFPFVGIKIEKNGGGIYLFFGALFNLIEWQPYTIGVYLLGNNCYPFSNF